MGSPKLGRRDARCRGLLRSVSRLLKVHSNLKGIFNSSIYVVHALPLPASAARCGANGRVMGIAGLEGRTAPCLGRFFCLRLPLYTELVLQGNALDHEADQLVGCHRGLASAEASVPWALQKQR